MCCGGSGGNGGGSNDGGGSPADVVAMKDWGPAGGFNPSGKGKDVLNIYDGQAHYKPEPGYFGNKQFQGMLKAGFAYRDGEFVASATNKKAQEKLKYYRPSKIISQRPARKEQYVNEELRG